MKKLKIFGASVIIFAMISTFTTCREQKQRKYAEKEKYKIETKNFDDVYEPVEDFTIPAEDLAPKRIK